MKRLFEVNKEFFATKAAAKEARGEKINKEGPPVYAHVIKRGPDHWKNK